MAGAALALAGCDVQERASQDLTENRSVEVAGAQSARVQLEMGAGELRLEGGTPRMLDADFRYRTPRAKPEVKYDVTGSRGYLTVRQPPGDSIGPVAGENVWDLRLNDKVPIDLRVNLGAGQGVLNLAGIAVRRLEISVGAGELKLDLNGPWDADLEAHIQGGVGQATVRLPRDVGVRVKASGGIGGIHAQGLHMHEGYYINDAYDRPGVRLRIDISGGIGQINLIG